MPKRKTSTTKKAEPLEKQLWKAADKLRKNINAAEYKHVIKCTLRKYGYPSDMQKLTTDTVLKQAEQIADELIRNFMKKLDNMLSTSNIDHKYFERLISTKHIFKN